MDVYALCLESLNLRVLVEGAVYEIDAYLGRVEGGERLHDYYVHEPVGHGSLWRNVGVVAVLRRIGAGDEVCLVFHGACLVNHFIGLGLVFEPFAQHVFDVGYGSTFSRLGKLQRDEGVESHAAGAEEGEIVDYPVVELLYLACVYYLDGFLWVERYAQMACESVA